MRKTHKLFVEHSGKHYCPDTKDPWEYIYINSRDPRMEQMLKKYNTSDSGVFTYDSIPTVRNVIQTVKNCDRKLFSPEYLLELYLNIFNSHIFSQALPDSTEYFRYAEYYINSNIATVSVSSLTSALGISQPHLYNIFIDKCGLSPKKYINEKKLTHAKRLLCSTRVSISNIAASVGYDNPLSFSRFFSFHLHMSPSEYRKKHTMNV